MLAKATFRKQAVQGFIIFVGATLTAFGTKYIFDPAGLVTGGVSGLSIIIRQLSETWLPFTIPLWLSSILLNVPIFAFAAVTSGLRSILRTGAVWLIMTVELYFFPDCTLFPDSNLLLICVYGAVVYGAAVGLLISARATSGGTDLLAYTLHRYFRHINLGRMIQIIDGLIVVAGAIVFSVEHTLFAVICVYLTGRVTDYIINTGRSAKAALIISRQSDKIAAGIMRDLNRGVTGLSGTGMFTGEDKKVLLCICSKRDIVSIKDIVRECDPEAFVVVADAAEVMGEGFIQEWT